MTDEGRSEHEMDGHTSVGRNDSRVVCSRVALGEVALEERLDDVLDDWKGRMPSISDRDDSRRSSEGQDAPSCLPGLPSSVEGCRTTRQTRTRSFPYRAAER